MSTKIIGNQIDASTRAIMEALQLTEQLNLPALNQSAVTALGTPAYGTIVYNSTEDMAQIYKQDAAQGVPGWTDVGGGGPSVGENSIIRTNGTTIEENLTIGPVANGGVEFTNGFSAGPITIANGYTVTIENNATWNILGGDDMLNLEVVDIITQDFRSTGMHFSGGRKEHCKFYADYSGDVTHSVNNGNTIYVTRNGGGNWRLNLTDMDQHNGDGSLYHFRMLVENAGANGMCSAISILGVDCPIEWCTTRGGPGQSQNYAMTDFLIIDKVPKQQAGNEEFVVLGHYRNYS